MLGGVGYGLLSPVRDPDAASLERTLDVLSSLKGKRLVSRGAWNPAQVFTHCAQSVEFSMQGFPSPRSAVFQQTIGALAIAVFSARRAMTHGLAEPIPGAPPLDGITDVGPALDRLTDSIGALLRYEGRLRPHFAYGELDEAEYALAQSLHILNHLEEIEIT